jgi:hypothetical protein
VVSVSGRDDGVVDVDGGDVWIFDLEEVLAGRRQVDVVKLKEIYKLETKIFFRQKIVPFFHFWSLGDESSY